MKSFASGNLSSKIFRELALDYGISYKSDLLSKLGIKSKHNRLLYSSLCAAFAFILVLAIWATGSARLQTEQLARAETQHIRKQFDGFIVGAPTYNTNATCQRTGTAWDDLLYSGALQELQLEGKPFAVFGCGDAVCFKNNFADAVGEVSTAAADQQC
ncbi:hypothetical protein OEZ86_005322 [Tetradesmus obliquus]|nr:hypothetical protein OEZ86_005322 [Tetradesmus obliquus]